MKKTTQDFCCAAALVAASLSQLGFATSLAAAEEPSPEDQIVVVVDDGEEGESQEDASEATTPKLWIGIVLKEIQGDLATYLQNTEGVFVDAVLPDSPAQNAGLEVGDIIVKVGNEKLAAPADLLSIIKSLNVKEPQPLQISLLRHGSKKQLKVTPATRPKKTELKQAVEHEENIVVTGGEDSNVFSLSLSGGESPQEVKELMQKLREGRVDKAMNIFRFGNPSIVWNTDEETEELTGDIEISIVKEDDGQKLEVTVSRKDDQPAEIQVKKGDELTEYTEENFDEMPEELQALVRPLLSEKKGRLRSLRILAGDAGEARIEGRLLTQRSEGDVARVRDLLPKELAEKYRAMAQEMAERSRQKAEELAKVARESAERAEESIRDVAGMPQELESLRKLVEDLRQEVKQLRTELQANADKSDN